MSVMRSMLLLVAPLGAGCFGLPTASEAGVSFSTAPAAWPADVTCLNGGDTPAVAKEILVGSTRTVVVAGGPSPISDEAWQTYQPSFGNQKNSDRNLLFSTSCFARSPDASADCEGDACRTIVELDGYTWVALSRVVAVDCVPATGGCDPANVTDDQLAFVVTEKCHELVFTDRVFRLRGPDGVEAIMHATADGNPVTDVRLPPGYAIEAEELSEPLVIRPFGGGDGCFYNILRDHLAQSYHQVAFADDRYPSAP